VATGGCLATASQSEKSHRWRIERRFG
jgi:hypothetical protein